MIDVVMCGDFKEHCGLNLVLRKKKQETILYSYYVTRVLLYGLRYCSTPLFIFLLFKEANTAV